MNKYVSHTLIIVITIPLIWFMWLVASVNLEKEEKIKETWKPSVGLVVESRVEKQSGAKRRTTYCPYIFAEHTLRETQYRAKLAFSDAQCSPIRLQTKKLVEKYTKGRSIDILVNPANPKEVAVRSYSASPLHYVLIACVIFLCVMLLWIVLSPIVRIVKAVISDELSS